MDFNSSFSTAHEMIHYGKALRNQGPQKPWTHCCGISSIIKWRWFYYGNNFEDVLQSIHVSPFVSFLLFLLLILFPWRCQRYCGDRYTDHDSDSKSNMIKTSKQTSKTYFPEIILFNYFSNFKLAFTSCHSYICYYNTSSEKAQSYWPQAMRTSFPQWSWNIFKH